MLRLPLAPEARAWLENECWVTAMVKRFLNRDDKDDDKDQKSRGIPGRTRDNQPLSDRRFPYGDDDPDDDGGRGLPFLNRRKSKPSSSDAGRRSPFSGVSDRDKKPARDDDKGGRSRLGLPFGGGKSDDDEKRAKPTGRFARGGSKSSGKSKGGKDDQGKKGGLRGLLPGGKDKKDDKSEKSSPFVGGSGAGDRPGSFGRSPRDSSSRSGSSSGSPFGGRDRDAGSPPDRSSPYGDRSRTPGSGAPFGGRDRDAGGSSAARPGFGDRGPSSGAPFGSRDRDSGTGSPRRPLSDESPGGASRSGPFDRTSSRGPLSGSRSPGLPGDAGSTPGRRSSSPGGGFSRPGSGTPDRDRSGGGAPFPSRSPGSGKEDSGPTSGIGRRPSRTPSRGKSGGDKGAPAPSPSRSRPSQPPRQRASTSAQKLPRKRSHPPRVVNEGLDFDRKLDLIGVALVGLALVVFFSVLPSMSFGLFPPAEGGLAGTIDQLLSQLFGWGKIALPLASFAIGLWLMIEYFGGQMFDIEYFRMVGLLVLFACLLAWLQFIQLVNDPAPTVSEFREMSHAVAIEDGQGGGFFGHTFYLFLLAQLGDFGAVSVMVAWLIVGLMLTFDVSVVELWQFVLRLFGVVRIDRGERRRRRMARIAAEADAVAVARPGQAGGSPRQMPLRPATAESGAGRASGATGESDRGRTSPVIRRRGQESGEMAAEAAPDKPKAAGDETRDSGDSSGIGRLAGAAALGAAVTGALTRGGDAKPSGDASDDSSGGESSGLLGRFRRSRTADNPSAPGADQPTQAGESGVTGRVSGLFRRSGSASTDADAESAPGTDTPAAGQPSGAVPAGDQPPGAARRAPGDESAAPERGDRPAAMRVPFGRRADRADEAESKGKDGEASDTADRDQPSPAAQSEARRPGMERPTRRDSDVPGGKPGAPDAAEASASESDPPARDPRAMTPGLTGPRRFERRSFGADSERDPRQQAAKPGADPASDAPDEAGRSGSAAPAPSPGPARDERPDQRTEDRPPVPRRPFDRGAFGRRPEAPASGDAAREKPAEDSGAADKPDQAADDERIPVRNRAAALGLPVRGRSQPDEDEPGDASPARPMPSAARDTASTSPTHETGDEPGADVDTDADDDLTYEPFDDVNLAPEDIQPATRSALPVDIPHSRGVSPLRLAAMREERQQAQREASNRARTESPASAANQPARKPADSDPDGRPERQTDTPGDNAADRPARSEQPTRRAPAAEPPSTQDEEATVRSEQPTRPAPVPPDEKRQPTEALPPARPSSAERPAPDGRNARPDAKPDGQPRAPDSPPARQRSEPQPPAAEPPEPARRPRSAPEWKLPKLKDLLQKGADQDVDDAVLLEKARVIEDTLASFGAPAKVVEVNPGPVITQFGVEPDYLTNRSGKRTRVKVSSIARLDADLALALAARSIRVEAPVPGKGFVGIEVPNDDTTLVSLYDIMESPEFERIDSKLRLALGLSVDGTPVAADLTAMPHLLIAGTTGSGKSVCVNAIISCLLLSNKPDEVQFIMVDPKRVELTGYNGIPHLVAPVVVDLERIVGVLQWVQREMEERYRKFAAIGARNIVDYNRKSGDDVKHMPYYVVVIDELADLMMLAPDETERLLARLAQMARATGIHLIISTQRPSVDIITGLIKANFPARIAFAVASSVDSRVILDQPGAEKLLGRGDMLFQSPDAAAPLRMQGVFVSDEELNRITGYWKRLALQQGVTEEAAPVTQRRGVNFNMAPMGGGRSSGSLPSNQTGRPEQPSLWDRVAPASGDDEGADKDELYEEAVDLVQRLNKASISLLQRRLRIGYTRAARLIDIMEQDGIVGPAESGSKPRDVVNRGPYAKSAPEQDAAGD